MKARVIVWRRRARQGYYGSARLDARASVPPLTRPPRPGSFASRFSSREAVADQVRGRPAIRWKPDLRQCAFIRRSVTEDPQLDGNLIRFGLPIEKHCVIVVKTLALRGERLFNDGQCRTVGMSVRCA